MYIIDITSIFHIISKQYLVIWEASKLQIKQVGFLSEVLGREGLTKGVYSTE